MEAILREYAEQYYRAWNIETRPYDGITELLDVLTERQIRMAVLSNKPQEATRRCVEYYLGQYSFAAVLGQQADRPRLGARRIGSSELPERLGGHLDRIPFHRGCPAGAGLNRPGDEELRRRRAKRLVLGQVNLIYQCLTTCPLCSMEGAGDLN